MENHIVITDKERKKCKILLKKKLEELCNPAPLEVFNENNNKDTLNDKEVEDIRFEPGDLTSLKCLLIYNATEDLHDKNIRDIIILFLIAYDANKLESYINTSIYFELIEDTRDLESLNIEFTQ